MTHRSTALILVCFGRGGSNIVLNMICNSPDVINAGEWHQSVLGRNIFIRKVFRRMGSFVDFEKVPGFSSFAEWRVRQAVAPNEVALKSGATAVSFKVMDRHHVFIPAIEKGYASCRFIVLTRHPFPMCEGFLRGGMTLSQAVAYYNEVALAMSHVLKGKKGIHLRFEDMLADPVAFYEQIIGRLTLRPSPDGYVGFKQKAYGVDRGPSNPDAVGVYKRFPISELAHRIDREVNRAAVDRLPQYQRDAIWSATGTTAQAVGYGRNDY